MWSLLLDVSNPSFSRHKCCCLTDCYAHPMLDNLGLCVLNLALGSIQVSENCILRLHVWLLVEMLFDSGTLPCRESAT